MIVRAKGRSRFVGVDWRLMEEIILASLRLCERIKKWIWQQKIL